MLETKNLSVSYGRHRAVEGVTTTVSKHEIVVMLGANGAGKSTFLRAIAGMGAKAPESEILLNGRDISKLPAHEIVETGIALVPEERGLFTDLSVDENLRLGANPRRARARARENMDHVLTLFPALAERRRQIVRTMSGGEQQMVALGRALMSSPDYLLLDEPSLGLSPILCGELFKSFTRIKEAGVGVLLVEQNAKRSLDIADRGYLLEIGHIVGSGTADELRNNEEIRRAYLGYAEDG
ncbi:MAG: ABC transporter ATP-binding protein [Alphaproteobacteria bacterium]|nr:ABC transporter ATP-binding protein [Alphaproteobacteria bacterium]